MNNVLSQAQEQTVATARPRMLPWLVLGFVMLFFAAPWGWEHKAHALLHGLCAQTPSHTLRFGSHGLPFDSRMTGIYGGISVTLVFLIARGRHRCARVPGVPTMFVLGLFVAVMAIDGFNSMLVDMLQPHLYQPDNRLRLVTGMAAGVTIACVLCFLFAVSFWRRPELAKPAVKFLDLPVLLLIQAPFYGVALSGVSAFALPISIFLIVSALLAITSIVLASIVLFRGIDRSFSHFSDLDRLGSISLLVALTVMGLLAGGRFALEHFLHLQPLT